MHTTDKIIGWREWVGLPELGLPFIKAKVDTGARTSALHAFAVDTYRERGVLMVRFNIHPLQQRSDIEHLCNAEVVDERMVTDSGGHKEKRYVILTRVSAGEMTWPIEVTLTNRDTMRFRMLLGRTALKDHFLVEPGRSFLLGQPDTLQLETLYKEV